MKPTSIQWAGHVRALAALELTGPDAIGFAQRISANDVAALAIGDWHWNCVLSPQGRVLSVFRLWRSGEQKLTMILPAYALNSTSELLARYLLRAKVTIADSDSSVMGGESVVFDPESTRLSSSDGRWLALGLPDQLRSCDTEDVSEAWQTRDVAQGVPWLRPDALETFTPQALSFERLDAFSVRKGCYPGQEIVARMHFLGQNKRTLRRFSSPETITSGALLFAPTLASRVVGHVVTTVPDVEGVELLAVVQGAAADQPIFADEACGTPLRPLAFDAPPLPARLAGLAKA